MTNPVNLPPGLAEAIQQFLASTSASALAATPAPPERTTADAVAEAEGAANNLAPDVAGSAARVLAEAVRRLYDDVKALEAKIGGV